MGQIGLNQMPWKGHLIRMDKEETARKIRQGNIYGKKLLGKSGRHHELVGNNELDDMDGKPEWLEVSNHAPAITPLLISTPHSTKEELVPELLRSNSVTN